MNFERKLFVASLGKANSHLLKTFAEHHKAKQYIETFRFLKFFHLISLGNEN